MKIGCRKEVRKQDYPTGLSCRNKIFRYRKQIKGKSICLVFGKITEEEAIKKVLEVKHQIAAGLNPKKERRKQSLTFSDVAANYIRLKKGTIKVKSISRYKNEIKRFEDFLIKNKKYNTPIANLEKNLIEDYFIFLRDDSNKKPLSKSTIWVAKNVLSKIWKKAKTNDLLTDNLLESIEAPKPNDEDIEKSHKFLKQEEVKRLLKACKEIDKKYYLPKGYCSFHDMVLFSLKTGIRKKALLNLEWSDICLKTKKMTLGTKKLKEKRIVKISDKALIYLKKIATNKKPTEKLFTSRSAAANCPRMPIRSLNDLMKIYVENVDFDNNMITLTTEYEVAQKGKNGEVPLSPELCDLLNSMEKKSNLIFHSYDGGKIRYDPWLALQKAQRIAKINPPVKWHSLRTTFAVMMRMNGVSIETLSGLLLHSDIRTTIKYYARYSLTEGANVISIVDDLF